MGLSLLFNGFVRMLEFACSRRLYIILARIFKRREVIVSKNRPVNLNIISMKFPITAMTSILHRATGLLLFLFIPYVLWLLWYSLSSEQHFAVLSHYMSYFILRFVVWVFMSALFYHLVAGIRHLLMDCHIGDTLRGGRLGAWFVMVFTWAVIIFLGIYILIGFDNVIW